jgi:hypothetical protein
MSCVKTRRDVEPKLDLASLHRNIADELCRLHRETLAMQAAISPELSGKKGNQDALLSLQALDAHAQILRDLSHIMSILGQGNFTATSNLHLLKNARILPSTSAAIFASGNQNPKASKTDGDVTFF